MLNKFRQIAAFNALDIMQRQIQIQLSQLLLQNQNHIGSSPASTISYPNIDGPLISPNAGDLAIQTGRKHKKPLPLIEDNKAISVESSFDKPSKIEIQRREPIVKTEHGENVSFKLNLDDDIS